MFNIQYVSSLIVCRRQKFLTKFMDIDNSVSSFRLRETWSEWFNMIDMTVYI